MIFMIDDEGRRNHHIEDGISKLDRLSSAMILVRFQYRTWCYSCWKAGSNRIIFFMGYHRNLILNPIVAGVQFEVVFVTDTLLYCGHCPKMTPLRHIMRAGMIWDDCWLFNRSFFRGHITFCTFIFLFIRPQMNGSAPLYNGPTRTIIYFNVYVYHRNLTVHIRYGQPFRWKKLFLCWKNRS